MGLRSHCRWARVHSGGRGHWKFWRSRRLVQGDEDGDIFMICLGVRPGRERRHQGRVCSSGNYCPKSCLEVLERSHRPPPRPGYEPGPRTGTAIKEKRPSVQGQRTGTQDVTRPRARDTIVSKEALAWRVGDSTGRENEGALHGNRVLRRNLRTIREVKQTTKRKAEFIQRLRKRTGGINTQDHGKPTLNKREDIVVEKLLDRSGTREERVDDRNVESI